mmetsp:Transcript_7087/g.14314  ORF Transcript_7087/g.14314 Transcript_7087/m.14314 type:complete len:445 (-) Transcript_7087:324-1658(-)|eukprot:CAMPEP_0118940928 /NCGR_PEP_ID=MMETSP1169-20130426/32661_1 /TAXON_ID=36882 /ORGANISM="Pyramimonas obovata, Strain CCMP722" /LENGTH=444 /DNA_ID=CAMNT_0006885557 /DNA_START=58 /DNA_END=1392 /DNA_ORIENTATION=-
MSSQAPVCPRLRWCLLLLSCHIYLSEAIAPGIASDTNGAVVGKVDIGPVDLLARGLALLDDDPVGEVPFEEEVSASADAVSETETRGEGHRRLLSDSIDEAIEKLEKARSEMTVAEVESEKAKDVVSITPSEVPAAPETKEASTPPVESEGEPASKLPALPEGAETYGDCSQDTDCKSQQSCVDGKCRCPVLFTGEECDVPRVPAEPWCLTAFKDWPTVGPQYTDLKGAPLKFATCAVVGSSGEMRGSGKGAEIDAHTAIFRFNEAPASPRYRADVGSFTTLRFQNRDRSGFAEAKGEICVVRQGKWSKGQDSGGKCRFIQMPRDVERYVDGHWKQYRSGEHWPTADPGRPWFSNGFAGITFALHMCARVDVYGFTFGAGYYFPKYKGPAKDWGRRGGFIRPPAKELDRRHSWTRESTCLKMLAELYPSQVTLQTSKLNKAQPI